MSPENKNIEERNTYRTVTQIDHTHCRDFSLPYCTSKTFNILVGMSEKERDKWIQEYKKDIYFKEILDTLQKEEEWLRPEQPKFSLGQDGLIYLRIGKGSRDYAYRINT
jgi:hypothetical protein